MDRRNAQIIVNIDGDKIRRCREAQGLTQLYLATVVEVTTDTISRWENRRSPTIKRENAVKLAEALGVPLEELLLMSPPAEVPVDTTPTPLSPAPASVPIESPTGEPVPPTSSAPPSPRQPAGVASPFASRWRRRAPWLVLVLGALLAFGFWLQRDPPTRLEAERIMPGHMAPNTPFPVLIRVSGRGEFRNPVLIREELSGRCDSVGVEETAKRYGRNPRWIGRIEDGTASFVYLVRPEAGLTPGDSIGFSGDVVTRGGEGSSQRVGGTDRIVLMPYHWADADRDYRISDDEILTVYELYGREGQSLPFDDLEQLWLAGAYAWNGRDFAPHAVAQRQEGGRE
ncbi:MAG: hypothetical protein BWK76_21970 [Desulfobulbaceae bacterium A2]|nr:MAG: hypothetical protein BWK76_21970 [Desulfobulbaceae bacterium A2]